MKRFLPVLFCCGLAVCAACTRPEDETPSKFHRQANIEKYVQQAKSADRLHQEREKPLPVHDLLDARRLTNVTQELEPDFLERIFGRSRRLLQKRLRDEYSLRSAGRLEELFEKHKAQARQAAREAVSPWDLAAKLGALLPEQDRQIQNFISEQASQTRLKADQKLLEQTRLRLQRRCVDFLERVKLYYGARAAELVKPVLDKAVQDYVYAEASASDDKELDAKLARTAQEAHAQIRQITAQDGDPLGVTPEEVITALRSDMITQYQTLENRIEVLYGKDAVLQARKEFNRLLEDGGNMLRESTRLSHKKQNAGHLNAHYRDVLLALQQQWNLRLQSAAGRPPEDYLASTR